MRFTNILFVLPFVLSGCLEAEPNALEQIRPGEPMSLSKRQNEEVQKSVRKSLKDPDSAQFGPIRAVKVSMTEAIVCGFVNARNSFGGYTGMKPFSTTILADPELTMTFGSPSFGSTENEVVAILTVCEKYGIRF